MDTIPVNQTDELLVNKKQRLLNILHNPLLAWLILGSSILATIWAYYFTSTSVQQRIAERFNLRSHEIATAIEDRLEIYEQVLWGGAGLFASSEHVSRKEWAEYVKILNINRHWPGIQGIGFSIPVRPEDREQHIASIRAEGFPEYTIKPEGVRDFYSAIIYLEPFDWRNQRAFGYDMWSNETRRRAMSRARDEGVAATSGIITLVQETSEAVQKGFLMYIPTYRTRSVPSTLEARRAHFSGWVYSPFRAGDLMHGILGTGDTEIDFEIFDGEDMNPETLLFDTNTRLDSLEQHKASYLRKLITLNIQGRTWKLYFNSHPGIVSEGETRQPLFVALAGSLIDLLLFYVIYSLNFINRRAQKIAHAMTEQLKEEGLQLKESEARFRFVADTANVGISLVIDRVIRWVNPKCLEIFQYPREEMENHSTRKMYPSSAAFEQFDSDSRPVLERGEVFDTEQQMLRGDGTLIWVRMNGKAIDPANLEQGVIWVLEDITGHIRYQEDLKQARDAAEQASRAKAEFLASMSHEIRTPMNGVIGMTSLLMETPLTLEQREYARTIHLSGEHLLSLINNILDFSKIDAGNMTLEDAPFLIHDLLDSSLMLLEAKAVDKHIDLHAEISPGVPAIVSGDVTRLRQILVNLLGNAVKFTSSGAVVVTVELKQLTGLRLSEEPRVELLFRVRDTGIGIAPDKINLLFQQFSQVDVSTTRKFGGTGLGLMIAKRLVEMMGGNIIMESVQGQGSVVTFTVFLTAVHETPIIISHPKTDEKTADSQMAEKLPLKILLAEDNPINQKLTLMILKKLGYEADLATNGLEVLSVTQQQNYDLIFMDVQMPEMDGLEATRQLVKTLPSATRPRIIAMTANALPGDKEKCLEAGMNAYLSKPITIKTVVNVLKDYAHHKNIEIVNYEGLPMKTPKPSSMAVEPSPEELELLDSELLEEFKITTNASGFQVMQTMLRQQMEEVIASYPEFLKSEDRSQLRTIAHKIKGAALCLGAKQLSDLLNQLQHLPDSVTPDPLPELWQQMELCYTHTMQALDDFLKEFV
ncbi:MAG: CHASE domain-containing protein [SAR324 cluster bacterium]|nr:CHASE domain-containing protein [SAR324 cluster bacterium]